MLPGVLPPRAGLRLARLRLSALRLAREQPLLLLLLFLLLLLCSLLLRPPHCPAPRPSLASAPREAPAAPLLSHTLPRPSSAASPAPLRMGHVVVGVMTARRFHRTRGRMQRETWLRRARRVVFFSDGAEEGGALATPLVAHAFVPSSHERVFAGGNWRAVPILRAMAEAFFSEEAARTLAARAEPEARWAFMCDDDSFTFTSELLATLARYDADTPAYLGYAFIAAPHLEGIVPGVRQPLFANGGAGIAVSRAAMRLVLPHLEKCEAEYKWNWPGDVRVAQCLLDVGVPVTWIHSFHAENPHVIIHKSKPPPGSVPVGLHLPPLSFHHVDLDTLAQLERMQLVHAARAGQPYTFDFAPLVLQPLVARHPDGAILQMHFGYEAFLIVRTDSSTTTAKVAEFLVSFKEAAVAADGGGAAPQPSFVQHFTGGECRRGGELRGGYRTTVRLGCGECEHEPWQARGAEGLRICRFTVAECEVEVFVSLEAARCPAPQPLLRMGLDVGTAAGHADVAVDGMVREEWSASCARHGDTPSCPSFRASRASRVQLLLHFRVMSGEAIVRMHGLSVGGEDVSSGSSIQVDLEGTAERELRLTAIADNRQASRGTTDQASENRPISLADVDPPTSAVRLMHKCPDEPAEADVSVVFDVRGYHPLALSWRVVCE